MNMTAIFIVNLNWLISPGLFCVVFLLEFRFLIYSNISYSKECRSWIFNGMLFFCLFHVFLCHLGCIYMVLSFERNEVNLFSIIPINIGGQYIISSPSIPGGGDDTGIHSAVKISKSHSKIFNISLRPTLCFITS